MPVSYEWRGAFTNHEVNALHAEAFDTRLFDESEWNWVELVHQHSLGWVVARDGSELVGFVNVLWDRHRQSPAYDGDQLYTGSAARAEVHVPGTAFRLGDRTTFEFHSCPKQQLL